MPIYQYMTQQGKIIQKLFSVDDVPQEIELKDGTIAKKIISKCSFSYNQTDVKKQDQQKIKQERKHYMNQYNVESFIPLKGQSEEKAFQDFKKTKYIQQQQILRKQQIRRQNNFKKWEMKRKSFKQMEKQYIKKKQDQKKRQYEDRKINI